MINMSEMINLVLIFMITSFVSQKWSAKVALFVFSFIIL
ncbi:hypothetical protein F3D3_2583 [Fusibacter sp. 3D3]|nr:hypothetical protein F3D3_2583 [Fusibacter sp. 3D3]